MKSVAVLTLVLCLAWVVSARTHSGHNEEEDDDAACMDSSEEVDPTKKCSGIGEVWLPEGEFQGCVPDCINGKPLVKCTKYDHTPSGCQCPNGTAQIPGTKECVPLAQCPRKCSGKGEVWRSEAEFQSCVEVCSNGKPEKICSQYKKSPFGCQCPEGTAQISETRECVHPSTCPQKCEGKGQVWLPQGVHPNCPPVCGKLHDKCNITFIWAPFGCNCPEGTGLVPGTKDCIPETKCPNASKYCPEHMIWHKNATVCTDSCINHRLKCDGSTVEDRCVCRDGYGRDENYDCIKRSKCKK